jgi:maltose-binding protein MalE
MTIEPSIVGCEHWTKKGEMRLFLWKKAAVVACCVLASLAALAAPAAAQPKPFTPDPVDMAAAKREAAVTWYTSTPVNTAQKIAKMFQTETGIKVELFRIRPRSSPWSSALSSFRSARGTSTRSATR